MKTSWRIVIVWTMFVISAAITIAMIWGVVWLISQIMGTTHLK